MTQTMTNTIAELISSIYSDNESHIDFMENMANGDCDCHIHITLNTILDHCGVSHTDLD